MRKNLTNKLQSVHMQNAFLVYLGILARKILANTVYHIAGNFRGRKFSRLSLHDTFRELNFKDLLDCHRILYYNKVSRN